MRRSSGAHPSFLHSGVCFVRALFRRARTSRAPPKEGPVRTICETESDDSLFSP